MTIEKKKENGEKYLAVQTEDEFHQALKKGRPVELTHELAQKIGLSVEDVGTLGDIIEAHKDAWS